MQVIIYTTSNHICTYCCFATKPKKILQRVLKPGWNKTILSWSYYLTWHFF